MPWTCEEDSSVFHGYSAYLPLRRSYSLVTSCLFTFAWFKLRLVNPARTGHCRSFTAWRCYIQVIVHFSGIFVVQCSVCFFVQMTFYFFDSILDFLFCIDFCFAFYRDEMCERNIRALCLCERKSVNAFTDPHLLDVLIGTGIEAANQLLSVLPKSICMTNPLLCQICEAKCCTIAV